MYIPTKTYLTLNDLINKNGFLILQIINKIYPFHTHTHHKPSLKMVIKLKQPIFLIIILKLCK